MSRRGRASVLFSSAGSPLVVVLYLASAAAVTTLVMLAAGRVSPYKLGLGLGAYLLVVGFVLTRRQPVAPTDARWPDVMPCYLSVQDRQLRIIETNEAFRLEFGDRIGERCHEAYKGRASPCPGCPVLETFEDGKDHTRRETVITKDGETAQVVVTSSPLKDGAGNVEAVVEMSTDVTELELLRQQLDATRQDYERLFNMVPCYITIHDREFRIVESNQLFRRDFGECRGERCHSAYKGADSICPDCPVEKSFSDGEVHSQEEVVVTRDGRQANVIVYSMPVRDESGEISAVMEVSTNISQVKQLQRQLAMMGLAVAGMAHRIKNILMGLEGGIFVVNTGFEAGDQQAIDEGWEMVERNVAKISRIVRDLLYCSKERAPCFEAGVEPHAVAREVHELYRPRAEREGIELRLELEGDARPGWFDPEGIHTLLSNLIANALDACRFDPGRADKEQVITVRCRQDEVGAAVLEVADTGAGIPEEASRKMFDSFFSTKGTEGTGLGLLVVQKVVEEHGGVISFESEQGRGTTFHVRLPVRPEPPAEPAPGPGREPRAGPPEEPALRPG